MGSTGHVLAVIPARAGSKGIPGKNLRTVAGRSLVRRCVESARATSSIHAVVVSTDGDDIAAEAESAGATVVRRPAPLAGDTASSESALLHALDVVEGQVPEVLVFLQATSPFIDPVVLDAAIERVLDGRADSVFAAVPSHAFLWRTVADGSAIAVNHDAATRPRRQERVPEFRETGAFYVLRTAGFLEHRHRFFGRTEIAVVDPLGAIDIDAPSDLALAEAIAADTADGSGASRLGSSTTTHATAPAALNGAP
uniref:Acylneuraminate cytidylyltransferase family protein n=1 Tax=Neobacillus citreus TaxID=2833578 RepID=A0A942T027_9BACI